MAVDFLINDAIAALEADAQRVHDHYTNVINAARAVCEQYPAGDLPQAMIELQKAVKAMEGDE